MRLSSVTFGESSSLKLIGKKAFEGIGGCEIHIPDAMKELFRKHFGHCPDC